MIRAVHPQTIGISAIAAYEPPWILGNDWFSEILPRKFVQHTGILSRHICTEDEVAMGIRAVENLQREVDLRLAGLAAVVFVSPSIVPGSVAREYLDEQHDWLKSPTARHRNSCAGWIFRPRMSTGSIGAVAAIVKPFRSYNGTSFPRCASGRTNLSWSPRQAASAGSRTMGASRRHRSLEIWPRPRFSPRSAARSIRYTSNWFLPGRGCNAAERVFFDYHVQENVSLPTPEGGRSCVSRRLVFTLDGLGIADAAPRAMADTTAKALRAAQHSARRSAVSRAPSGGDGHRASHGNETGGDRRPRRSDQWIDQRRRQRQFLLRPYALRKTWDRLEGTIVCPTAGVGHPGDAEVSHGCVILQATDSHR